MRRKKRIGDWKEDDETGKQIEKNDQVCRAGDEKEGDVRVDRKERSSAWSRKLEGKRCVFLFKQQPYSSQQDIDLNNPKEDRLAVRT